MKADSDSTFSSHSDSSLLRMRDIVKRFNVSATTIRRSCSDGSLRFLALPSGHRRFKNEWIYAWLGFEPGKSQGKEGGVPVACVTRVSTSRQNRKVGNSDKSSLQHQEERVLSYIEERWGDEAKVTRYSSQGSGMDFNRISFLRLISDLMAGKYKGGYVVATDMTRICRFGIKLVEFIAQKGDCQIVYTMGQEDKALNETLTEEILSILTHYTARASGEKSRAINQVPLNEDQLREAYHLYSAGHSYRSIEKEFRKKGWGKDGKARKISRYVIQARLTEKWAALEKLYDEKKCRKNSFIEFVEKHVRRSKNDKTRLSRKRLVSAYEEYCKREKQVAISSRHLSKITQGYGWQKKLNAKGSVNFVGLSMVGKIS